MDLQITIEEKTIKDFLKQNLIGKNFGYCWDFDVKKAFDDFLRSYNIDTADFTARKSKYDRQLTHILYKNEEIGYIEVKKQKGQSHYSWLGGSYCDWTFKDVNVMLYAGDLNKSIKAAEERIVAKNEKNNKTEQAALKLYKLIVDNCKDSYEADQMIDYIKSHKYTLRDKLKESAQA